MSKKTYPDLIVKYGLDVQALTDLSMFLEYIKDGDMAEVVLKYFLAGKSQTEIKYRQFGKALIKEATGHEVMFQGYEWFNFRIPGGSYTPDWCYLLSNGQWAIVEVKASKHARGYRDQRSKLRAAATLNPWHLFYEIRPDKKDWTVERIKPDEKFLQTFSQIIKDE